MLEIYATAAVDGQEALASVISSGMLLIPDRSSGDCSGRP